MSTCMTMTTHDDSATYERHTFDDRLVRNGVRPPPQVSRRAEGGRAREIVGEGLPQHQKGKKHFHTSVAG